MDKARVRLPAARPAHFTKSGCSIPVVRALRVRKDWVRFPAPRPALVVQWIGCLPPKEAMQVRFLPRAHVRAHTLTQGRLAQLVRALPSHGRGQEFESSIAHSLTHAPSRPSFLRGAKRHRPF